MKNIKKIKYKMYLKGDIVSPKLLNPRSNKHNTHNSKVPCTWKRSNNQIFHTLHRIHTYIFLHTNF